MTDDDALAEFRQRAGFASQRGDLGAFPNFYFASHGVDDVGGTVFVHANAGEWRDVPLSELNGVSLNNFGDRMRATNAYASQHGFRAGFPNGHDADYGNGTVCGSVLLKDEAVEWRDVPLHELGGVSLDDVSARFRATSDYAVNNGFVGGFPNMFHADNGNGIVCGTVLIRPEFGEWKDVTVFEGPR